MRKRYRVLIIAAFVAALVVPVGYALSLEPQGATASAAATRTALVETPLTAVLISPLTSVPDAGKLLIVGTVLIGLSLALKKRS